jgi:DNA-binding XRE family transcriptional regulator
LVKGPELLRARKFLTHRALAKAAGVSPTTVYSLSNNEVEPHFSTCIGLAEALNIEPSELVEEEE